MKMSATDIALQFKSFTFFESFSEDLLLTLAKATTLQTFEPGHDILKQGQENNSLFFLRSGEVDILVHGEVVANLNLIGEVMGEMSVITQKPVTATIRAKSQSEFFILNSLHLLQLNEKDKDKFQSLLFRVYSMVLTERLTRTNDKARRFEITNRDLERTQWELKEINKNLESQVQKRTQELIRRTDELIQSKSQLENQNAALLAGFKKVADLAQIKVTALEKIKNLATNYLMPFKSRLTDLAEKVESPQKEEFTRASDQLQAVVDFIKPLTELHKSEKAMESKRILLADEDKKQQMVAKMALGGTGLKLDIASDMEGALALLKANQYDLVFCEVGMADLIRQLQDHLKTSNFVMMTSHEISSYLEPLKNLPNVVNVVSRNLEDRTFTVKNIVATATKVLNQDFFGFEKYLAWGVDAQEKTIRQSGERLPTIDEMLLHFKRMGIRGSILDRCQVIAEELLMNAIYDAPHDSKGNALYNHLPRTTEVALSKEQAAKLRYACDGNLLAISVEDPFGALHKEIIIDYLDSCYRGQAGSLNSNKGGAGRGLHQIVESSDLTIFNVRKNIKTEVIAIINIDTLAQRKETQPTFHYFFS